jgi:hypothetical protein
MTADSSGTGPNMSADKTAKVQTQVDDVTKLMQKNVQDAMKRGENLEDLESRTAALEEGSRAFNKNTEKVKSNLWYKNMKYWAIMIGIVVAIILVIVLYFSGGKLFSSS